LSSDVNIANLVDHAKYTKRFILFQNSSFARDAIFSTLSKLTSKKNQLKLFVPETYHGVSMVNISLRLPMVSSHFGSIFSVDNNIHSSNSTNKFSFRTANFLSFNLTNTRGCI
jgi:hypothetical protein